MIKAPQEKKYYNLLPPFENLHTNVFIATVSGKSMSGKSFMTLELINRIKQKKNLGVVVLGADYSKSPVYTTLKDYYKENITFIPDVKDDSFDEVWDTFDLKYRKNPYRLLIVDDISGLLKGQLKKDLSKQITTGRHLNTFMIFQLHRLAGDCISMPILRTNANIICVSRTSAKDLEYLKEIVENDGIDKTDFNNIVKEAKTIPYSFIVYCTANTELLVCGEGGFYNYN